MCMEKGERKRVVREAMFRDLDTYWKRLGEARVTHLIHPTWEERVLSYEMKLRYTHTVMHNLALGRGPLRAVVNRGTISLCKCRYGCDAMEDVQHVILGCSKVEKQRIRLRNVLLELGLDLTLETVFNCPEARNELESLIGTFFRVFDGC